MMKRARCSADDTVTGEDLISKRLVTMATPQPISVKDFVEHVRQCQLQKFSFDYYMHGLVEEAGEVFEAVRVNAVTDVLDEIGDVLWYAVSFAMELRGQASMPDTWPELQPAFDKPAHLLLLSTVAKLSGRVKKVLRGDKPFDQFVPAIMEHFDAVIIHCSQVAANHGATLEKCAAMNMYKLAGRFQRGTVRGDGER